MKHIRTSTSSAAATALPTSWKTSVQSKSLLIAIAAFALTTNGAQAFSGEVLERAGLSETQRHAFETARELRAQGNNEQARDVLVDAGIDTSIIERVRAVVATPQNGHRSAGHSRGFPMRHRVEELTTSEQQAYQVALAANDRDAMDAILEEAGILGSRGSYSPKFLRDGRELQ